MIELINAENYSCKTSATPLKMIKYFSYNNITFFFENLYSNSARQQAIVIGFSNDFSGTVIVDNKKVKLPRKKWRKLIMWEDNKKIQFWEDFPPSETIKINISIKTGYLYLCSGFDPSFEEELRHNFCDTSQSVFTLESINENEYIVKCEEVKGHGKFDDLTFNMKVELG